MTKHQISIANNDVDFMVPIERFCKRYNLTTKIYVHENKGKQGWTSTDIRIYNTLLCNILENLCGKLSHNKFVSEKIVFSNYDCIRGFLDAYISGDGSVCSENGRQKITVASVSKQMLLDVQIMLTHISINSKMYKSTTPNKDVIFPTYTTKLENIHQGYNLIITNQQCKKLANILNLTITKKQERIEELRNKIFNIEYSQFNDNYFPNIIDGDFKQEPRDGRMMDLEFDQIVSIEEVPNTTPYAYDLTVEDTRNFNCYNGLCEKDTFHLSGVASKSNVTRGVPRIEEILRLTKNPKNPSMSVFLKPLDETEQDKANNYSNMLEHTRLVDVVKSIQICFDPNEKSTFIEDDKLLLEQFYEFEDMIQECIDPDAPDNPNAPQKSKWIIRMEMDSEILLDKNITMDDIHFAISNSLYGQDINCVYSDYNMDKLIFRIRMNSNVFNKSKKRGVSESLDQSDEIYLLKNFQDAILNNIVLRGVNGIKNVMARKLQNAVEKKDKKDKDDSVSKEDGKYVKKDIWMLDTTGSNLLDTLAIDFIDYTRTISNDIKEVFDILGIEAARQMIYNELTEVMEFSDVYINYHHSSLLCDRMTCNKDMVAIFRSGLLNDNTGPIAKGTFEVHTEVFLNAARHAEFDHMRGVSANIMCGQYGYYGTSAFNLVLDMKEFETLDDMIVDTTDKETQIDKMFGNEDGTMDLCSKKQLVINNNISNIKQVNTGVCVDEYDPGF